MKPATLIVMCVGLIVTILGFSLCFMATKKAESDFPDDDLFRFEGENFEITDEGDTLRTENFSDTVQLIEGETTKIVEQDVKVLSVTLSGVDNVEIIGGQDHSIVHVYNMQAGRYACRIGSGVMTVTNAFQKALIFDYLTDIMNNFDGIRKYFNPAQFEKREQKVVIYIDDDDLLNRIDLNFTNCKNVTVKNLTCSLDCKVVLDNSNIDFDNCKFKEQEIIWDDVTPETPSEEQPTPSPTPDEVTPSGDEQTQVQSLPAAPGDSEDKEGEDKDDTDGPTIINHYLTLIVNMKNGSTFNATRCAFSSVTAIVNKRVITEDDIEDGSGTIDSNRIGTYASNNGKKCTFNLDMSVSGILYGFEVRNVPDEDKMADTTLVTTINGYPQGQIYLDNAGNKDYPQISVNASNCEINIKN
ncbi:MAG: hypothetical protein IJY89_01220 [Clostridia bacterium]|nr:hypothetical protein [Clostridia bacterium]